MALPHAFKTDESFLEKISMGAIGANRTFENLQAQGHIPLELERGSTSFKIWKAIKIKRQRVPDILCLKCATRIESRAKGNMEISMSHSHANQERGWDYGLDDHDLIAYVLCTKAGEKPWQWVASSIVHYVRVRDMRKAWAKKQVSTQGRKGSQEGFEVRVKWPAAVADSSGVVEVVSADVIKYRAAGQKKTLLRRLVRRNLTLIPCVTKDESVQEGQILAAVVPVLRKIPCEGGATTKTYQKLARSVAISDRYTAVKALGHEPTSDLGDQTLSERMKDEREHIYVRVEAAAGLMRHGDRTGRDYLASTLGNQYLEHRLEAAIILSEVGTPEAEKLLIDCLRNDKQHAEIRAGAAWSLGEVGAKGSLGPIIESFNALDTIIKVEAARSLSKLAKKYLSDVVAKFPTGSIAERPGMAWALSHAGGFTVDQLLSGSLDEDARQWIAYIIGTQKSDAFLKEMEKLSKRDSQVYFAVTMLWKVISSWVYELEEY